MVVGMIVHRIKKIKTIMPLFKTPPIPIMEEGPERALMKYLLLEVKHFRGLTTTLVQIAGIKSKWLRPEEPRNISSKRMMRITIHTMHFLGREECKHKAGIVIDYIFDYIIPDYINEPAGKQRKLTKRHLTILVLSLTLTQLI